MDDRAARGLAAPRVLVPASAIALTAAIGGAASLLLIDDAPRLADVLRGIGVFVAPTAMVLALGGLLLGAGTFRRRGGALFCITAGIAAVVGGLAQVSWGVGFDQADAGVPQSAFAQAFSALLLGWAVAAGAAGVVLAAAVLRDVRRRTVRTILAVLLAAVGVPAIGLALVMPMTAVGGSAALLVLALRAGAPPSASAPAGREPGRTPRGVVPLALLTALGGGAAAVFALTGSAWPGSSLDGTTAMNVGLSVGALAAIPLVLALLQLRPDAPGAHAAAVVGSAALLAEATSQAVGAGSPVQGPLWILAAALAGTAGALLLLPRIAAAAGPLGRVLLAVGIAAAVTLVVGLEGIVLAPLAAPLAALLLLGLRIRRGRTRAPALVP